MCWSLRKSLAVGRPSRVLLVLASIVTLGSESHNLLSHDCGYRPQLSLSSVPPYILHSAHLMQNSRRCYDINSVFLPLYAVATTVKAKHKTVIRLSSFLISFLITWLNFNLLVWVLLLVWSSACCVCRCLIGSWKHPGWKRAFVLVSSYGPM
jgi:hypothetical protein